MSCRYTRSQHKLTLYRSITDSSGLGEKAPLTYTNWKKNNEKLFQVKTLRGVSFFERKQVTVKHLPVSPCEVGGAEIL